jgi:hypothetical protein
MKPLSALERRKLVFTIHTLEKGNLSSRRLIHGDACSVKIGFALNFMAGPSASEVTNIPGTYISTKDRYHQQACSKYLSL